ncbi:hypothetical protein N0V94_000203 [Neodidymelliopsis sp. IMI 364377]|nr:hypothetical protein N0V94_000203 [Neodidymelliopsis sp. IMI 364377]
MPAPTGTGLKSANTSNVPLETSSRTSNASCTVHIPDASIEWWYPPVYSHALATITSVWGNFSHKDSYTFLPHTTSFDAVSALETEDACTSGWATYMEWDWTAWECLPYTEKPTAASTAVIYRTAVPPIPTNSEIPTHEIFSYDVLLDELPSATTLISVAPNSTVIKTSATPFVQFTAYEVEYQNSTEMVHLSSIYIQEYWKNGIEHDTIAAGYVPQEFLEHIPHSACDAGKLKAVVTVLILVNMYYINAPTFAPGIVHWESTALGWEEDTPVVAFDQSMTSVQPHVASDWDLSDITNTPVVDSVKTHQGTHPMSTTRIADGSKASQPRPSASQTVGTVGTAPVVIGPSSIVVVGSQILLPGGPAVTVDDTPVALAPSATVIVVGGTWLSLPQNLSPGRQKTVGILGSLPVVLVPSSGVIIGSQALQPGGIPITFALRTTISLAPSATALVIGATTSLLPQFVDPTAQTQAAPPVLTIGPSIWVPNAATQFFIGPGQTLTPGGTAVVDGTKISLDTLAAFVVIGGSTQILPVSSSTSGEMTEKQPELVFGGSTFTAISTGHNPPGPTFVVSGQTLAPGGAAITVLDTVLSLAPSGSFLVIDGYTTTITTLAAVAAVKTDPPTLTIGKGIFRPLPGTGTSYQIGTALLTPGSDIILRSQYEYSAVPSHDSKQDKNHCISERN